MDHWSFVSCKVDSPLPLPLPSPSLPLPPPLPSLLPHHFPQQYVLPVKLAAARTLCLFIRHIRKADQRQELCTRIIEGNTRPTIVCSQINSNLIFIIPYWPISYTHMLTECARSPSCRHRLLFIEICHYLLDIFSRSFFKENFFEAVIKLAHVSLRHRGG